MNLEFVSMGHRIALRRTDGVGKTLKEMGNTGVMFYNDPVSVAWPYLKAIERSKLSLSAKNDAYSKIVSSVSIGSMDEALALLIECAMLSKSTGENHMVASVVSLMYSTVKEWYVAECAKHDVEKSRSDCGEGVMHVLLARDAVVRPLKDEKGGVLLSVHPRAHANLLVRTYPDMRFWYQKFK